MQEFVGGICEAKILATNSTSRGVIYQFRIFDASISLIYQIFLFLTDPQTLPHLVGSPLTKSSPSHRCLLFSCTHLKFSLSWKTSPNWSPWPSPISLPLWKLHFLFDSLFSLLNLLPPQIFDSCLCKRWVVKSDYESFKVGWTWWPGCCSFLVVRMRGLGVVELSIWFDAMGAWRLEIFILFGNFPLTWDFYLGRTMKFGPAFVTLFKLPWKKNNGSEKTTKAWMFSSSRNITLWLITCGWGTEWFSFPWFTGSLPM